MKNIKSFVCIAVACMLCACSSQTETPEISALPTLRAAESANISETASTSFTPGTPTHTANTTGDFVPDESAPIQLSLSFTSGVPSVKETRMYKAAMEYMRRHPDVYIDLRYTQVIYLQDSGRYAEKLTDSLSKGTAEDIAILNYSFPIQKIAAASTLVDFEGLIESDNDVMRTDFFENILDGMKHEGGLYVMPLTFNIPDYVINKEYTRFLDKPLEEYKTIDYRDMMAVYEKVLANQTDGDMPYMDNYADDSGAFLSALDLQSINYDTRTVDIHNEVKRDLLQKAMNLPLVSVSESAKCKLNDYFFDPEVNTLFADGDAGGGTYYECYMDYEDIKYTNPIPMADFNGDVHFVLYEAAVISQSCRESETAWDFLKFLMGYDKNYPESDFILTGFYQANPVQRDLFNDIFTEYFERHYERNLELGRTPLYPKEEAIRRAIASLEQNLEIASKLHHLNDFDVSNIWMKHYTNYYNEELGLTTEEILKALELDLVDLLAKY